MKVRILDNSIRFRVSKDELEQLANGQFITRKVEFPSKTLTYIAKSHKKEHGIDLFDHTIELSLNSKSVVELSNGDKVGFSFTLENLSVLFEKDFKCLTERAEDESRLFDNPATSH